MNCVVKTLVRSLVSLAIVISPVMVLAIQIPNDLQSAGGGDISSLMGFAQPRPFASVEEVGSLTQFIDSSAGFAQSLAPPGGQGERSRRSSGSASANGNSSVSQATTSTARLSGVSRGACGCVGGGCDSEPSSNAISAMIRMVTQVANCLISGD